MRLSATPGAVAGRQRPAPARVATASADGASRATATSGQFVFALVALGVLLVTFNGIRPVSGATLSDLVFVVGLIGGLAFLASRWTAIPIAPLWLLAAAGLLLCAALLVGIFPARPSQAALLFPGGDESLSNAGAAIRFVGTLVFLPVLIAVAANSVHRIRFLADIWIAGAALSALVGTLGYLHVGGVAHLVSQGGASGAVSREAGLTTHSNTFALASAMALAMAAARLGRARGRSCLYFSAVVLILISAIVISGSRAGLIGGAFGLMLLAALHREGRKGSVRTAVVAALLAAVIAFALSPAPPPAVERLLGGSDPSVAPSTQRRVEIYPAVWHEVLQRPVVGHGFENLRGSHNIYLQLLHAGGLIALVGFLLFAVGSTATGFRLGRSQAVPDELRSLARGLVASLAVWLVAVGIVQPAIFDRYLYIPVGLIIAIWVLERIGPSTGSADAR